MRIEPEPTRLAGASMAERISRLQLDRQAAVPSCGAAEASGRDEAILSPQAQDVLGARRAYAQTSDVRADKVAALKRQVAEGKFQVDADLVARKLMSGGV
jgi:flagellar biosynthesis anti-sigma factor FlgM